MSKYTNISRLWSGCKRVNIAFIVIAALYSRLESSGMPMSYSGLVMFALIVFEFFVSRIMPVYSWVFFANLYDKKTSSVILPIGDMSMVGLVLSGILTSYFFGLIIVYVLPLLTVNSLHYISGSTAVADLKIPDTSIGLLGGGIKVFFNLSLYYLFGGKLVVVKNSQEQLKEEDIIHKSRLLKGSRVIFVVMIPVLFTLAGILTALLGSGPRANEHAITISSFLWGGIFLQIIATRGWLFLAGVLDSIIRKIKISSELTIQKENYKSFKSLFIAALIMSYIVCYIVPHVTTRANEQFVFATMLIYYSLCYTIGLLFGDPKKK